MLGRFGVKKPPRGLVKEVAALAGCASVMKKAIAAGQGEAVKGMFASVPHVLGQKSLLAAVSREIKVPRQTLVSRKRSRKTRRGKLSEEEKNLVKEYLFRDDVTRPSATAKHVRGVDGVDVERRFFTDTQRNLYCKFRSEEPEVKIGMTRFICLYYISVILV